MAQKSWYQRLLPRRLGFQHNILAVIPMVLVRKSSLCMHRESALTIFRYCMDADGNDVLIEEEATTESADESSDHDHEEESSTGGLNCHFHAGVE